MAIDFRLTTEQLEIAETEAKRRQSYNENKNYRGRNRAPQKGDAALAMHQLGCIGELSVAYYLGLQDHLFANEAPVKGSYDLPNRIEVKTRGKHGYDLLIQLDDDPSKLFILVTHEKGFDSKLAKIVGWTYGKDVMRAELVREFVKGRPCYAIPQNELKDIDTLSVEIAQPVTEKEILSGKDVWITHEEDEIILNFSEDLISKLGWNVGDILEWDVDPHGAHCILRKANVRPASVDQCNEGGEQGTA